MTKVFWINRPQAYDVEVIDRKWTQRRSHLQITVGLAHKTGSIIHNLDYGYIPVFRPFGASLRLFKIAPGDFLSRVRKMAVSIIYRSQFTPPGSRATMHV